MHAMQTQSLTVQHILQHLTAQGRMPCGHEWDVTCILQETHDSPVVTQQGCDPHGYMHAGRGGKSTMLVHACTSPKSAQDADVSARKRLRLPQQGATMIVAGDQGHRRHGVPWQTWG